MAGIIAGRRVFAEDLVNLNRSDAERRSNLRGKSRTDRVKNLDPMRVVLDTNVLVAAVRSRQGASFALVDSIPTAEFQICLSVGLYAEWQEVLTRPENLPPGQGSEEALGFLRYLASQAYLQDIHFLWRPLLTDADDDMVVELAFSASCQYIITHNTADFRGAEILGVSAITPRDFLKMIRTAK